MHALLNALYLKGQVSKRKLKHSFWNLCNASSGKAIGPNTRVSAAKLQGIDDDLLRVFAPTLSSDRAIHRARDEKTLSMPDRHTISILLPSLISLALV